MHGSGCTFCRSDAASSADVGCDCSAMRSDTPELAMLKRGCELFASWGWTSGSPQLECVLPRVALGIRHVHDLFRPHEVNELVFMAGTRLWRVQMHL